MADHDVRQKDMKTILAAAALLSVGILFRSTPVDSKTGDWIYTLDQLPAEIRINLAGITERRSEFSATCDVMPGQVSRLFTKAKKTATGWDGIYEYGGIVSGRALVSINKSENDFVVSGPTYLKE